MGILAPHATGAHQARCVGHHGGAEHHGGGAVASQHRTQAIEVAGINRSRSTAHRLVAQGLAVGAHRAIDVAPSTHVRIADGGAGALGTHQDKALIGLAERTGEHRFAGRIIRYVRGLGNTRGDGGAVQVAYPFAIDRHFGRTRTIAQVVQAIGIRVDVETVIVGDGLGTHDR